MGGALELARRLLGERSRATALHRLKLLGFGGRPTRTQAPAPTSHSDWVRWPEGSRPFTPSRHASVALMRSLLQDQFERFIGGQWGLGIPDAERWGLRWTVTGRHAWRVVIPVLARRTPVGFQTRAIRPVEGGTPKYLNARAGDRGDPAAECGRHASEWLFNIDAARAGEDLLLVEGAGDVMGWHRGGGNADMPAVALLGVALTCEKASALALRAPARVVVALDADAAGRTAQHVQALLAWGIPATPGRWEGAKDAGAGARLAF